MTKANDIQVGGDHYTKSTFQVWDWITKLHMPFMPSCISKYLYRWRNKNGLEDLQKSHHYLVKYIEVEKERHATLTELTQKFLTINDVPPQEHFIIGMLVEYQLGNMMLLEVALKELNDLILQAVAEDIKGRDIVSPR